MASATRSTEAAACLNRSCTLHGSMEACQKLSRCGADCLLPLSLLHGRKRITELHTWLQGVYHQAL